MYRIDKRKKYLPFFIDKDNGMDRNKLIQKLNEYRHRIEQLDRYTDATKNNSTALYVNENSPYQRRDSTASNIVRTEEDDYNDKAKVRRGEILKCNH